MTFLEQQTKKGSQYAPAKLDKDRPSAHDSYNLLVLADPLMRKTFRCLWCVPFVYWSKTTHILSSAFLFTLALLVCSEFDYRENKQLQDVQVSLDLLTRKNYQVKAGSARENSTDVIRRLLSALPSPSIVDALQADISRFAEGNRVQLISLTTEHASVAAPDTPRIVLQVSVRGDYAGIKSWLSELLARYPTLSLQQLQIQNASQDPASGQRQEARVTLMLYVRAH
ncbi:MAG: hypothetical protein EBR49_18150 [Betaproteobacteria bacterium]|nr:hypothetical protein [Betaproteobacteria bacterium]